MTESKNPKDYPFGIIPRKRALKTLEIGEDGKPLKKKKGELSDVHFIITYGVVPNKDDPTRTDVVVTKKERISEMVQSASEDLGFQALLKKAARGLINPYSWYDDGSGSVRDDLIPEYVGDLQKKAKAAETENQEILSKFGLSGNVTPEEFEAKLNSMIAAQLAKQQGGNGNAE